jgi:hypothetical protein
MYNRADIASQFRHGSPLTPTDISNNAQRWVHDIQESNGWWDVMNRQGWGAKRGLMLSLCTDGVSPFKHKTYSMWPIMMTVLNLPEHLRNQPANMLLLGVVPGPDAPRTIQPYLDLIVDELLELQRGVPAIDASRGGIDFILYARLLVVCADYKGHGDIMEMRTNGYHSCIKCTIKVSTAQQR